MLSVKNIEKTFFKQTPDERKALNKLSFDLKKGEFAVVIGSNGAGKSTLLNSISGEIRLDQGTIQIDERDVTKMPVHKRAAWVSRVFQDPMMGTASEMTIEENLVLAELRGKKSGLRLGLKSSRKKHYQDSLALLGLGLEDRLQSRVETLSGGQRQSLTLIMAVLNQPKVLLLDEHTAALDPKTASLVMKATLKTIEEFQLTAIMVTHNMQHAIDTGHRILMLEKGRVLLDVSGEEKQDLTVETLVERFHIADDKILLAG